MNEKSYLLGWFMGDWIGKFCGNLRSGTEGEEANFVSAEGK